MFFYFCWNLPRFFSMKKCKRILRNLFGIVSISFLPSRSTRDFYHRGCVKLMCAHPLIPMDLDTITFEIGTRFPIFVKRDESISSLNLCTPESDFYHDFPQPALPSGVKIINDFENIMDVLDGFESPETSFELLDDLTTESLCINASSSIDIPPSISNREIISQTDFTIHPINIEHISLSQDCNLCLSDILPSSVVFQQNLMEGVHISPSIYSTKTLQSDCVTGIDISPHEDSSYRHVKPLTKGSGKISTLVRISQALIDIIWHRQLAYLEPQRESWKIQIEREFSQACIYEKLQFPSPD